MYLSGPAIVFDLLINAPHNLQDLNDEFCQRTACHLCFPGTDYKTVYSPAVAVQALSPSHWGGRGKASEFQVGATQKVPNQTVTK